MVSLPYFLVWCFIVSISSGMRIKKDLIRPNRIVGGEPVNRGDFPWQVSLQRKPLLFPMIREHFCGATLINETWALTAAHCAESINLVKDAVAVVGAWDLREINMEYKIVHVFMQDYDTKSMINDIALLKLESNGLIKNYEDGSPLEDHKRMAINLQDRINLKNETCFISGWGKLSSKGSVPDILHAAKVGLQTDNECYQKMSRSGDMEIYDTQICAGGEEVDTCQGDSGGPLVCCDKDQDPRAENCKLTGITSWGVGCATPGLFGVYTEVAHYREWIRSIIDKSS